MPSPRHGGRGVIQIDARFAPPGAGSGDSRPTNQRLIGLSSSIHCERMYRSGLVPSVCDLRRMGLLVALFGAGFVAAPPANASPVKECGNAGASIRNVTARNLTCRDARRMAREYGFVGYGNGKTHRGRYTCRTRVNQGTWWVDVRCTFWFYVVRWQYSSGE